MVQSSKRGSTRLFSWGEGGNGRLGNGDDRTRTSPTECTLHRVRPRRRLGGKSDLEGGGGLLDSLISMGGEMGSDLLSEKTGHAQDWWSVAGGGNHSAVCTRTGQVNKPELGLHADFGRGPAHTPWSEACTRSIRDPHTAPCRRRISRGLSFHPLRSGRGSLTQLPTAAGRCTLGAVRTMTSWGMGYEWGSGSPVL